VTNDRATGLAFKEYVEFLARWPKVTNLIPERAFFSSLDASSSRLGAQLLGFTRRSLAGGSTSDPAQAFRRWS
jgi:hypothetical protein